MKRQVHTSFLGAEVVRLQAAADRQGMNLAMLLRYFVRTHPQSPLLRLYRRSPKGGRPVGDPYA